MTIEFHDPRAKPLKPAEPYELTANLVGGVRVALLANGFPDSEAFLQSVEGALGAKLPAATFRHYNKGNASILCSNDMMDTIVNECDVFVSAYGH